MRVFFTILLAYTVSAAVPSCPKGWKSFEGATHCYAHFMNSGQNTIGELLNVCAEEDKAAYPASIHSDRENQFLSTLGRGAFGLTWSLKNKNFLYTDGTPVDFFANPVKSTDQYKSNMDFILNLSKWIPVPANLTTWHPGVFCERPAKVNPVKQPCPEGFKQGTTAASKTFCYFIGKDSTWMNAKTDCEKRGSALASIHSAFENNYVTALVGRRVYNDNQNDQLWIGGFQMQVTEDWRWTDGSSMSYTNWDSSNGGNELTTPCTALRIDYPLKGGISLGQWFPFDCYQKQKYYVCKTNVAH